MDVEVTEVNVSGDQILGTILNTASTDLRFVSATYVCFNAAGNITTAGDEFAEPIDLIAGGTGAFGGSLFDEECVSYLAGATGQGSF